MEGRIWLFRSTGLKAVEGAFMVKSLNRILSSPHLPVPNPQVKLPLTSLQKRQRTKPYVDGESLDLETKENENSKPSKYG
jgi:hypothetical protein